MSEEQPFPPEKFRVKVSDRRVVRADDENQDSEPQAGAEAEDSSQAPAEDTSEVPAPDQEPADLQRLAEDRLDQLLRLKADYENFRKRVIREQTEIVERASRRIVERLLPVLDDLERALASARDHGDEALVRGLEIVLRGFGDVLASEGLEKLDASGAPFNPHEHEAMSSQPGDVEETTVLEVVRPGYKLKGKTIRPALVRVEAPAGAEEE